MCICRRYQLAANTVKIIQIDFIDIVGLFCILIKGEIEYYDSRYAV